MKYLHINLGHAANQELKLALIEDVDEFLWNKLVEAGHECIKLLLDTLLDAVLDDASVTGNQVPASKLYRRKNHSLNVFLLVFLCHRNGLSARL